MSSLSLGNLEATRDWGHSKDYVRAMWMMLQQESPKDYVCSTGRSHSVGDVVDYVFSKLGLLPTEQFITIDPKYFRPQELNDLKGDSSLLRKELEWKPEYTFEMLLDEMVQSKMEHNK